MQGVIRLAIGFLVFGALAGCGGDSSSGRSLSGPPSVDAGPDQVVDEGERVTLSGSSSSSGSFSWRRVSGPFVLLQGQSSLEASFQAPSVSEPRELVFELRVLSSGGRATDQVTVTVMPVNHPPVADAGADQTVDGLSTVVLQGVASDPEGDIDKVRWTQTAGEPVTLENADTEEASFTAPGTSVSLELVFEFEVTDGEGLTDRDTVVITVIPQEAPLVERIFPPASGVFTEAEIDVTGTVEARGGADIDRVEVDAGADVVMAELYDRGRWRASSVPVLADDQFVVRVRAFDTNGQSRVVEAELAGHGSLAGEGPGWRESVAVAVDNGAEKAWVLAEGARESDLKLFSVDLATGARSASVTDFTSGLMGPRLLLLSDMAVDFDAGLAFVTGLAREEPHDPLLVSVDLETGSRELVSANDHGNGPLFSRPLGVALGPENTLLVADNQEDAIFTVDRNSGDRGLLVTSSTAPALVAPLHLAYEPQDEVLLASLNVYDPTYLFAASVADPTENAGFGANGMVEGPDLALHSQGIALDRGNDRLFVLNGGHDNLISVDLFSGNRTMIAEEVTGSLSDTTGSPANSKGLAHDATRGLVYVAGSSDLDTRGGLYVIDPVSGNSVLLSR